MKLLKELQSHQNNLWWVFFVVKGTRLSGQHATNAQTEKEAAQIVNNIDSRYDVKEVKPLETIARESGETIEEFMGETPIPKFGQSVELEMGT